MLAARFFSEKKIKIMLVMTNYAKNYKIAQSIKAYLLSAFSF